MVVTRSQGKGRHAAETTRAPKKASQADTGAKRKSRGEGEDFASKGKADVHTTKRQRQEKVVRDASISSVNKLDKILSRYGEPPLEGLVSEKLPASQVVLAHIFNALLSSTRISHNIARNTLSCLLDEKYHDIQVLHKSAWLERTQVLTAGGYVHYREKTATYLGDLAELIKGKYDDDASKMLPDPAKQSHGKGKKGNLLKTLSSRLEEIKGLGPVGIDIFLGSIQGYFPAVAPFLDSRSLKTAKALGLGDDLEQTFEAVARDASIMAKLEVALTTIRLEKLESEFT